MATSQIVLIVSSQAPKNITLLAFQKATFCRNAFHDALMSLLLFRSQVDRVTQCYCYNMINYYYYDYHYYCCCCCLYYYHQQQRN